uniref:Uncharacterized protein n=1 Tax=Leersia perrieri TaxID=77586 RepID=A0A0D9XAP5_9ORYZ
MSSSPTPIVAGEAEKAVMEASERRRRRRPAADRRMQVSATTSGWNLEGSLLGKLEVSIGFDGDYIQT